MQEKGKLVNRISRTELAIVNSIGITNPSCFDDVADYLAESGTAGTQMAKGKVWSRADRAFRIIHSILPHAYRFNHCSSQW